MRLWREIRAGLRALWDRGRSDEDLADEVAHWLEEAEADLVAGGASPQEARRTVRGRHGDGLAAREQVRSAFWEGWIESSWTDVRLAARRLLRDPVFTAAAVLTLGLGTGAAAAIYGTVRPVLFDPLPYPNADAIVAVGLRAGDGSIMPVAFGTHLEFADRARVFSALAVHRPWQATLSGGAQPLLLEGQRVSLGFFDVLGVPPALGRSFDPAADRPGGPDEVILSDGLWRERYGADPAVVGTDLRIDGRPHTVVGVMPADFRSAVAPAARAWAPLRYDPAPSSFESREWGLHLGMVGRLRAAVLPPDAATALAAVAAAPVAAFPRPAWASLADGVSVRSLRAAVTESRKATMVVLACAMLLLLLVTCANLAILVLGRNARRRGELAVRTALGAGRRRLVRYLAAESLVLAAAGGLVGVTVAAGGTRLLGAMGPTLAPTNVAGGAGVGLLFGLAVGVCLLVGLAAALPTPTVAGDALRQAGRSAPRRTRSVRSALVISEMALAVVLSIGAGLLLRSTERLFSVPTGFETDGRLVVQVQGTGLPSGDPAIHGFFDRSLEAVRQVPGVRRAAWTSQLPLSGDADVYGVTVVDGRADGGTDAAAFRYAVSPGYFEAMGVALVHGRTFADTDVADAPRVAVLGEATARRLFGRADPMGARLHLGPVDPRPFTVVGVVADVVQGGLSEGPTSAVYVPTDQWHWADRVRWLVVEVPGDGTSVLPAVRRAVWSADADQPIVREQTLEALVARSEAERRTVLLVLTAFAASALVLATVGLYGVLAGAVGERTREMGVRAALGASGDEIRGMVVRQGMGLAVAGIALGTVAAALASGVLATLLFDVSRLDAATYGTVGAALATVAALACWVPARRAARVDPATALLAD